MDEVILSQEQIPSRIGLIAGSGQFPLLFAHAAAQANVQVIAIGFEDETDPALARYVHELHVLKLGQLNRLIRIFKDRDVTRAAMAGAINKTKLYTRIRPDWRVVKLLGKLRHTKDDHLLRAIAGELESEGIQIEASTILLPSLLAPEGVLTRRKPNRHEEADIVFGWELAKGFGKLDIGQCMVVKDRSVLAVEGIDGTDATIIRGGRLCGEGAIVIKVSKPHQDLRFDVPAVGLATIETMHRVKARVLAIEAGRTLMFDRDRMIDAADHYGISVVVHRPESVSSSDQPPEDPVIHLDPSPSRIPRPVPSRETIVSPATVLIRKARPDAVRVGVVGVGYLGRFHAQKYARLPSANLVAVADLDGTSGRAVAHQLKTDYTKDYRELIGRVEAVSIATPTPSHFSIAREFLAAGVHVLLEKPMTRTVEEADELIDLAERNRCVFQIGHLERFNSAFRTVSKLLRKPMFLEADRLALFNERGLDVDVILDLMIHDIDIALHIINSPLVAVRASGTPVLTALPDIASARLEFANGAAANLTASRISTKNLRKVRIFQEDSYLVADYSERRAYAVFREKESDEEGYPQVSMEEMEIEERDALEEEVSSFLHAIRSNSKPVVDGLQGRQALAVALEISSQIKGRIAGQ